MYYLLHGRAFNMMNAVLLGYAVPICQYEGEVAQSQDSKSALLNIGYYLIYI